MEDNTPNGSKGRPPKNATDIIRKPRRTDLPNAVEFPEGDNNKYTTFALAIMQFPKIDVRNPEQLQNRVVEYFPHSTTVKTDSKSNGSYAGLHIVVGAKSKIFYDAVL